jgi:hypothetical protein
MCDNAVKKAFGGDGKAWRREQADILDWAKNLYYPQSGGSLIPETDNKATWESWKNKFLNWKDAELAKPETSRWWYTYPRQGEESGGGNGGDGGGFSGGLIETGDGLGPYPAYNKYFPMLTTAYEAPGFQDWSAYMTPGVFSGDGGALYQPWAGRDFSYTPPEFSVGPVQYYAPVSPLEIIFEEEMSEEENNSNSTGTNPLTDLDMRGGKGPGDVGYGTNSPDASKGSTSSGVASQTTGLGEPDNVSPSAEWGGGHTSSTSSGAVSGASGKGKGLLGGGGWP